MFRVYDLVNNKWVNKKVYVDVNGDIYIEGSSFIGKLFGLKKLNKALDGNVVLHGSTGKTDSNGNPIYEADICHIAEVDTIGFVAFAAEIGVFCIFDESNGEYYVLSNIGDDKIEVIGNLFDSPELLPRRDAAQEDKHTDELDEETKEVQESVEAN